MDRRQLLFGMTALGLATNFNLNNRKQALIEPYVALDETTARDIQVALKLGNLEPKFLLARRL